VSEPVFRLGVSRTASRERLTLWEQLQRWFRKTPASPRLAAIPRPPRSVLLSRTTAEITEDSPESGRAGGSKRH
jgi:hypothetical protein